MRLSLLSALVLVGMLASGSDGEETYTHCAYKTQSGNVDGYMTMAKTFHCDQGDITLSGAWGDTISRGYEYHTELGELSGRGEWQGYDAPLWGEWERTADGFTLVGPSVPKIREKMP